MQHTLSRQASNARRDARNALSSRSSAHMTYVTGAARRRNSRRRALHYARLSLKPTRRGAVWSICQPAHSLTRSLALRPPVIGARSALLLLEGRLDTTCWCTSANKGAGGQRCLVLMWSRIKHGFATASPYTEISDVSNIWVAVDTVVDMPKFIHRLTKA